MKDFFAWILENEEWIRQVVVLLISAASYIYAAVIHSKSKKRLETLEAKKEAEAELLAQLQTLKEALEKGAKNGKM